MANPKTLMAKSSGTDPANAAIESALRTLDAEAGGVAAITAALHKRAVTGVGSVIEIPMAENLAALRQSFPAAEISAISAANGTGIPGLKTELEKWLNVPQNANNVGFDETDAAPLSE
jgi:hypothetical protein